MLDVSLFAVQEILSANHSHLSTEEEKPRTQNGLEIKFAVPATLMCSDIILQQ